MLHRDYRKHVGKYEKYQRMGQPLHINDITVLFVNLTVMFEIWAIEFVDPFPVLVHYTIS